MTDKPEAVAQWQRRPMYLQSFDPPGKVHQWQNCSAQEATGHFERTPGYEYRPLYAHPPQPDASALVEALRAVKEAYGESESARIDAALMFEIADNALTAWEAQHG